MADIITVNKLGWQYAPLLDGGAPVTGLNNVSCYMPAGSFTGIIGPTGAGKTTLARALAGIVPHLAPGVMTGFVRVAGMNVKSTSVSDLSHRVGYVCQNPKDRLFAHSVGEEVAFALENRGIARDEMARRVDDTLAMLHIGALKRRDPATLSAGEAERVAIASALAAEPEVLVVDEATSALDARGRETLFSLLGRLRDERGLSVVLIDQDTAGIAGQADAVFLMVDGEIIRRTDTAIFEREKALLESVGVAPPREQGPVEGFVPRRHHDVDDPVIAIDHVSVQYPQADAGQPPALNDVTFQVPRGAFLGVTGPNGSGKSTLAGLLNGTVKPTLGRVDVAGMRTSRHAVGQMAQRVAVVRQNPDDMLVAQTVRDEIAFGPRKLRLGDEETRKRVEQMLGLFDLFSIEDADPRALSYGERRAVALACALAMKPDVLVLDEPTAGLDRRLSSRLMAMVRRLNAAGTTIVMISSDERLAAEHCSDLVRLDNGALADYCTRRDS